MHRRGLGSSPSDRPHHRRDDAVLGHLVEIGVHGQADDLFGDQVGDRQPALGAGKTTVGILPVQGLRIIDRGRNPLGLERRREASPFGTLGTVTRPRSAWEYRCATRFRASISSGKILSFSISTAAWMVSRRAVSPIRTLSYLPAPWPCTRRLTRTSRMSSSAVNTAP